MTFEEWLNEPSGFGNFTRGELLTENLPSKLRDFFDDLSTAYSAGYDAGYEKGDYLEGWDEGYKQAKKEFAEKRGYPW